MDAFRYWLAVFLVTLGPPAFGIWFAIHPFARFWRRVGPRVTYAAVGAGFLCVAAALFLARERLVVGDLGTHVPVLAAGAAVLALASYLRLAVQRQLSAATMSGLPELMPEGQSEQKLLTEGLYARMRHPRYAQATVGMIGWALVANYAAAYAVALAAVPFLYGVAVLEERELCERFGDEYRRYQARVPRFFPRLRAGS